SETLDTRNQAGGRYGNSRHGNFQSTIVVKDPDSLEHVVVIIEGLAHPHEYDAVTLSVLSTQQFDLGDDFGRRQVAGQSELPGEAERATQRTAHLRGNTERHTIIARNQNRLDQLTIIKTQKIPLRSIA